MMLDLYLTTPTYPHFYAQKISFVLPSDKAIKNVCVFVIPHLSDHCVQVFLHLAAEVKVVTNVEFQTQIKCKKEILNKAPRDNT